MGPKRLYQKKRLRCRVLTLQIWHVIPNISSRMASIWFKLTPHTQHFLEMGSQSSYQKRRVWDTEFLRSKYIQIWHYRQHKFKNDFKSVQVGFTYPTLSQMCLYQNPCFRCGIGQGYSRHHAVLAPHAKSPWSPPVVLFPVLFLTAAPLSCTFAFPPQNHSVPPAYRWNQQKLAQQPLLSTKRESKHLGDAFGNKTVFFYTLFRNRAFRQDFLILFAFYFSYFFCFAFLTAHLSGSFKPFFICRRSCFSWHGTRQEKHPIYALEHVYI